MTAKKFYLDRSNRKFKGVCAGIANYTGIDVTWVRVGAVLVTLLGAFPWTLIAYGLAAWFASNQPLGYDGYDAPSVRGSTRDLNLAMRDIDRRLAEVDSYVATSNTGLASEIEKLR